LSQTEENALRTLKSRLLTEWAVASGLKQEQASERLNLLLKENHE